MTKIPNHVDQETKGVPSLLGTALEKDRRWADLTLGIDTQMTPTFNPVPQKSFHLSSPITMCLIQQNLVVGAGKDDSAMGRQKLLSLHLDPTLHLQTARWSKIQAKFIIKTSFCSLTAWPKCFHLIICIPAPRCLHQVVCNHLRVNLTPQRGISGLRTLHTACILKCFDVVATLFDVDKEGNLPMNTSANYLNCATLVLLPQLSPFRIGSHQICGVRICNQLIQYVPKCIYKFLHYRVTAYLVRIFQRVSSRNSLKSPQLLYAGSVVMIMHIHVCFIQFNVAQTMFGTGHSHV